MTRTWRKNFKVVRPNKEESLYIKELIELNKYLLNRLLTKEVAVIMEQFIEVENKKAWWDFMLFFIMLMVCIIVIYIIML